MSEQFDPNKKVTLNFFGFCSYEDSWTPGEPLPPGWGLTESNVKENAYVTASDYDLLLADRNKLKAALDQVDDVLVVNWGINILGPGQQNIVSSIIEANGADAQRLIGSLRQAGYVIVPREPSTKMLSDAWAYIHDEDGAATWREMIDSYLGVDTTISVGNLDKGTS